MGQVFTWDSIQTGKIPELKSFAHVASALRERFSDEPSIVTALFFGSVPRRDYDVRSDLDCAVIYETAEEKWAMSALHEVDRLARSLYVPINFVPCDTLVARTRLHNFGVSFVRHLQSSIDAGGLIKGTLVDLLAPTIPDDQEIESYIRMKMYNLQESFAQMTSFSEERLVAFLKKALEASTHVARKMLIYKGTLLGDSKREVRERYLATMPTRLASQFDDLLGDDFGYSLDLDIQREGPDQEKYRTVLYKLQERLPSVLEFLRSNILYLDGARQ